MKVFIPYCDAHRHLLEPGEDLVPYSVEFEIFSCLEEALFLDADPEAVTARTKASAHPPGPVPAGQPGRR